MTTLKGGEVVLKTDVRGRVQMPAARRESLLDEFERSGLSGAKFAALAGIKYQTFAAWAHRRRKQRGATGPAKASAPPADQVRWLEAVIEQAQNPGPQQSSSVVLRLPGGACLEIADEKQARLAAAFVRALAHPATSC
jgi:hypothetical protein